MRDIYENDILCKTCNKKTRKGRTQKDGFTIRTWECPKCKKVWHHPADTNEYLRFNKLKQKNFKVKLRKVGNSFSATIPNEILEFEGIQESKIISLQLESANKLSLRL